MFDIIDNILNGRWFKEPSPFQSHLERGHPKLCVITGQNTTGKSVLRKIIHNHYYDRNIEYMSISQEQKCSGSGIERVLIYGTEQDESTGYNSVKTILKAIQTGQSRENPFAIMLDEPEIGCSEETQAGIGLKLVKEIDTMPNLDGLYVVTHSRQLVKNLISIKPTHWHLGNKLSLEEWLERDIVPANLEALLVEGKEKWHAVNKMRKIQNK